MFCIIGHALYSSAYAADFLYLILIGRIVNGVAFASLLYVKRYVSDSQLVGIRRRTMLAGWVVFGQGAGLTVGPFLGGIMYKVGFRSEVFNGYTSPGWLMAGVFAVFWICVTFLFEEQLKDAGAESSPEPAVEMTTFAGAHRVSGVDADPTSHSDADVEPSNPSEEPFKLTSHHWGVIACMCWQNMLCFFILGAWETNIPVYGAASHFQWSPFASGNFIALGGILTFPFLLSNIVLAPRMQDRHILASGTCVGLVGLLLMTGFLATDTVTFPGFLVAWFLVALGFSLASTVGLSLLSKQLPAKYNGRTSLLIQYSNYLGRVVGAIWGGSGVKVGMLRYIGLEIGLVGIGAFMFIFLWRDLKSKTG